MVLIIFTGGAFLHAPPVVHEKGLHVSSLSRPGKTGSHAGYACHLRFFGGRGDVAWDAVRVVPSAALAADALGRASASGRLAVGRGLESVLCGRGSRGGREEGSLFTGAGR
jgi:hypothetical protein